MSVNSLTRVHNLQSTNASLQCLDVAVMKLNFVHIYNKNNNNNLNYLSSIFVITNKAIIIKKM